MEVEDVGSPRDRLNLFGWIALAVIILAGIVIALILTLGRRPLGDAPPPQFQSFTAVGVPWCTTRYRAAYANEVFSGPSMWTGLGPSITTEAVNNIQPSLRLANAPFQALVSWQRQIGDDAQPWLPVQMTRVGGRTFVDVQHPCPENNPAPGTPEFREFQVDAARWLPTSYSVSVQSGSAWSPWSDAVQSPSQSVPVIFVPDNFDRNLVFRRRLLTSGKMDQVGEIIHMDPGHADGEYVDHNIPGVLIVVSAEQNRFFAAIDDQLDTGYAFSFTVAPGSYEPNKLLALVADHLSLALGLTTVDLQNGRVRVHGNVPHPTTSPNQAVSVNRTYRVQTKAGTKADGTLSPNSSDGPTLNTLLGYSVQTDASSCSTGSACVQLAPSFPTLT